MKPKSGGFSPHRWRVTAFASFAQRDGNGLLDRLRLCQRMAGTYRSILLPVIY
jgi:hypothetical protein